MTHWRTLVLVLAVSLQPIATRPISFTFGVPASDATRQDDRQSATSGQPKTIPVPPTLYQKWRKYGPWDYKQQSFEYRAYTLFNFGATGSAAGLDQRSLLALSEASKPKPDDFDSFGTTALQDSFARNIDAFEILRKMTEKDANVIRIAPDFTWLVSSSAWPREDLGFSKGRWDEYRALFKKLALAEGVVRTKDFPETVFFVARARGLCTGGSSEGYAYSTKPLSPLTESPKEGLIAEMEKNANKHHAFVFRPLGGNWYAFYQADW